MPQETQRKTHAGTSAEAKEEGHKKAPPDLPEWLASGGGIFINRVRITKTGRRAPGQKDEPPELVLSQVRRPSLSLYVNSMGNI